MLWKFNRFLPEKPCQTGTLAKTLLLMLIDVRLSAICVILPPAPSVLQEDSSGACVNTRGSVRRASGFVLTGKAEVVRVAFRPPVVRDRKTKYRWMFSSGRSDEGGHKSTNGAENVNPFCKPCGFCRLQPLQVGSVTP